MKIIVHKIVSFFKKELFIDDNELNITFVNRQKLVMKVGIWYGLITNIFFMIMIDLNDIYQTPVNGINVLVSFIPCYYFVQTNQINKAKFFSYFLPIIFQTISSYLIVKAGYPFESGELALIPYATMPAILYKKKLTRIALILNFALFFFIKIVKYQTFDITFFEFYLELAMSGATYLAVITAGYFYKVDFIKLKNNNDKLNVQKQIIETQAEELKAINSTKNRLFSIIAHDIRSPLSSLKGVMQLIDNEYISKEEFKELSNRLQQNVDNVHGMLENLLLWSLSQMEGIKPNLQPFDLNFIIDETVLIFKESSTQKQIVLVNNSKINLPALGDEYQIKTVLRNLLNNAIKFTPPHGQIAINSSIKEPFINLKITDSGVGMERNELMQIFSNPTLKTGTAGEKGTGFGLFLCKELIEKNGGTIEVKSAFGKGTTIDILLPLMVN